MYYQSKGLVQTNNFPFIDVSSIEESYSSSMIDFGIFIQMATK